jgi:hypothetical protein
MASYKVYRIHRFEYAGLQFDFCQRNVKGLWVVDMGVLHTCENGKKLLDNEQYYYNAFVTGRNIWLSNRGRFDNVQLEEIGSGVDGSGIVAGASGRVHESASGSIVEEERQEDNNIDEEVCEEVLQGFV